MQESLILVLTRKCFPCACSYCNVYKQDEYNFWDEVFKNEDYFKFNMNKLLKLLKNFESIRFFGGEVFLKKEILVKIIKYLRSKGFEKDIYVNTNLHLFEKKDINWIKENQVKIITSLNGDETLHCQTRGVKKQDYEKLIDDIKFLKENKVFIQINTVLFPYEEDFIGKIKDILILNTDKINLLPLMYSKLVNKESIPDFLEKIEKLLYWIDKNKLQYRFLNFDLVKKGKSASLPLVTDEVVLDSDGNVYKGMVVLEGFFNNYKNLLFLCNFGNNFNLENDYIFSKINLNIVYKVFDTNSFIEDSIYLSDKFSNLLIKYKKKG